MATSMKFRGNVLTTGSFNATNFTATNQKVGSTGTILTKLLSGSLKITSPSFAATAGGSSLAVSHSPFPNLASGDKVFVQAGSTVLGSYIASASATAASTVEILWATSGCQAVAESTAITLQYLAIGY